MRREVGWEQVLQVVEGWLEKRGWAQLRGRVGLVRLSGNRFGCGGLDVPFAGEELGALF